MKSFSQFLTEARRNPEKNPKIGLWETLWPYRNDNDIYISFVSDVGKQSHKQVTKKTEKGKPDTSKETILGSAIASALGTLDHKHRQKQRLRNVKDKNTSGYKLGINPHSKYKTPNGLYTYPVKELFSRYADKKTRTFKDIPFAADQPGFYLIRAKGKMLDLNNYRRADLKKVQNILSKMMFDWAKKNRKDSIDDTPEWYQKEIYAIITQAPDESRIDSAGSELWNLTRVACYYMLNEIEFDEENGVVTYKHDDIRESLRIKMTTMWNKMFRTLGYDGAFDKSGEGIIHPSEPIQAVFFDTSKQKAEVVDWNYNRNYPESAGPKKKEQIEYISFTNEKGAFSNYFVSYLAATEAITGKEVGFTKGKWSLLILNYFSMLKRHLEEKDLYAVVQNDLYDVHNIKPADWLKPEKVKGLTKKLKSLPDLIVSSSNKSIEPVARINMKEGTFIMKNKKKKTIHHFNDIIGPKKPITIEIKKIFGIKDEDGK